MMDNESEPPQYAVSKLTEALANDERVSQLDIAVQIINRDVVLTGTVSTHERRDAISEVARHILPDFSIVNHVDVIDLAPTAPPSAKSAVRVAAVGDIHYGTDSAGQLKGCVGVLGNESDVLLLAGDLTRHGTVEEASLLVDELRSCPVPVVAVLGNHDHQSDSQDEITKLLFDSGIQVLECSNTVLKIRDFTVGIAGTKGFAGGFVGKCGSEFGERIQKEFIAHTRALAEGLKSALNELDTDFRIALTHFSPVEETLRGEPLEIYPWLGSYLLADAIDHAGCDWVFHGHAHGGSEIGTTPAGIPVRNVAQPVIRAPFKVYCMEARVGAA